MPDPQRDIAPIIEPAAPAPPPVGPDYTLPLALGVGGLLLLAVLAWRWRKRAPLHALRKLAHTSQPIAGANTLATLMASQHITPPADWQEELQRLRFGPPADDAAESLVRLCGQAENFLKTR